MNIKEQVINKTIKKIENRLVKIEMILKATPESDICRGRLRATEIISKKDITDKDKLKMISLLAAKEKELFKLAKKRHSAIRLIREKVTLMNELADLKSELWMMGKR